MPNESTCATCRYVGTYKRPRIMEETGFDDQLMFDDEGNDETVFMCKAPSSVNGPHAGKEIGLVPITCEAFRAPEPRTTVNTKLDEIDRLLALRAGRAKKDEDDDR